MGLFSTKEDFPGKREYVCTVHTAFSGPVRLYAPILSDLRGLDLTKPEEMYRLAARSVGMNEEAFLNLPLADGQYIVELMADAIRKLRPFITKEKS